MTDPRPLNGIHGERLLARAWPVTDFSRREIVSASPKARFGALSTVGLYWISVGGPGGTDS